MQNIHTDRPSLSVDPLPRYREVRAFSEGLCRTLTAEDHVVQSMPDVSPTRWHLAHTTWFFETFLLKAFERDFRPHHPRYEYLFNSYYNAVGEQFPRPRRGLMTRPTVAEVMDYRAAVDERVASWLSAGDVGDAARALLELGFHHEQQHQELMLTDILHVFSQNPLRPVFRAPVLAASAHDPGPMGFVEFEGGLVEIGHAGSGFAFDNEGPRHKVWLEPFALADRLVTAGEFAAFIADGGYDRPELWLSEGWAAVRAEGRRAPLYWEREGDAWGQFTLTGFAPLDTARPICHVDHFEADAYARWAGARLPSEAEWETAAASLPVEGNFVEAARWRPVAAPAAKGLRQLFGDVWEWTASPYTAYPGYAPAPGAVGEYNGKFMSNQMVLRGGSFGSSATHLRATYRNFFPSGARWQFTGIRPAKSR